MSSMPSSSSNDRMVMEVASEMNNGVGGGTPTKPAKVSTLNCILCGGRQIYPGPRYENHLINEHGAILEVDLLIRLTLFKDQHGNLSQFGNNSLPAITDVSNDEKIEILNHNGIEITEASVSSEEKTKERIYSSVAIQTESVFVKTCLKCRGITAETGDDLLKYNSDEAEDLDSGDDDDIGSGKDDPLILAYLCPMCPRVFKRHSFFKQHACTAHEMEQDDIVRITAVNMSQEEFNKQEELWEKQQSKHRVSDDDGGGSVCSDETKKRNPFFKNWEPNSFASFFVCYFCNEQFSKDYKLKLHLMLSHRDEPTSEMAKAKELITKGKLDGCVHKCGLCGTKYNSVPNFSRHIRDVHNMSRAQYTNEYGSSEIISRTFKCELCDKEIKHTRNIIASHMKLVHLISWKEYQDILLKIRQGEFVGKLPTAELFDCLICGVSIKYKREHLNKKHQISEEIYEELIVKKDNGEDIADVLPEVSIYQCMICERECLDIEKHITKTHQLSLEQYEEVADSNPFETKRIVKQLVDDTPSPSSVVSAFTSNNKFKSNFDRKVNGPAMDMFTPTDLQCYFGCQEHFKKDYQLYLHLKLRHRHEPRDELRKAYESAEEEIALTKRSGSIYKCALCNRSFNDNGAFYGHIQTKHQMKWPEYKETYGRCEVESAPFECKICNRVIKYDRNTIHTHLKCVHGINWTIYLDRIRKIRNGEIPADLPAIQMTECRVCNLSVKHLRDHLKNCHRITELEYESLFQDDEICKEFPDVSNKSMNMGRSSSMLLSSIPPIEAAAGGDTFQPLPKPPKEDIQNKVNKHCSSCQCDFETRRQFIEHCTTVHGMKFKTKSGMTISAPKGFFQQQQQQHQLASVKRPIVEEPTLVVPAANHDLSHAYKRAKFSTPLDAEVHDGLNTYNPTAISKWNQCKYECCFCHKTSFSRSSMTSHIANTHGIPVKVYKEEGYPDIEVETNMFGCRLCPTKTKFVKDCIAPHLKMVHSMTVEQYEERHMKPQDWPYQPSEVGSLSLNSTTAVMPPVNTPMEYTLSDENSSAVSDKAKWNKCRYKCAICEWESPNNRQVRTHIQSFHQMDYQAYLRQYGSTEIERRNFFCEICFSEMKFSRPNIYMHMRDVHKISLDEYVRRVGYVDPDTVDASIATQMMEDSSATPHSNSKWDKCRFQCAVCKKVTLEKKSMKSHVIQKHNMNYTDYEATYGDCEVVTEYFFCGICHAEVKHCHRNISNHLLHVHNMTTMQYDQQFGSENDSVTAPRSLPTGDFGGHFLLDDQIPVTKPVSGGSRSRGGADRPRPDKADIMDPRNKYCSPCSHEFSRRGAFLDHCRNVHRLKINVKRESRSFASMPIAEKHQLLQENSAALGGFPCSYCGRVYSSRSNLGRHINTNCEVAMNKNMSEVDGGTYIYNDEDVDAVQAMVKEELDATYTPNGSGASKYSTKKCPYPHCDVTRSKTRLLKRHLLEAHNIQSDLLVKLPDLESEKRKLHPKPEVVKVEAIEDEEDRKVPPLRVKLLSNSEGVESPPMISEDNDTNIKIEIENTETVLDKVGSATLPQNETERTVLDEGEKVAVYEDESNAEMAVFEKNTHKILDQDDVGDVSAKCYEASVVSPSHETEQFEKASECSPPPTAAE